MATRLGEANFPVGKSRRVTQKVSAACNKRRDTAIGKDAPREAERAGRPAGTPGSRADRKPGRPEARRSQSGGQKRETAYYRCRVALSFASDHTEEQKR